MIDEGAFNRVVDVENDAEESFSDNSIFKVLRQIVIVWSQLIIVVIGSHIGKNTQPSVLFYTEKVPIGQGECPAPTEGSASFVRNRMTNSCGCKSHILWESTFQSSSLLGDTLPCLHINYLDFFNCFLYHSGKKVQFLYLV